MVGHADVDEDTIFCTVEAGIVGEDAPVEVEAGQDAGVGEHG